MTEDQIRQVIAAFERRGYVMVEVEPTEQMVEAGRLALAACTEDDLRQRPDDVLAAIYRAMVAARAKL